MKLLQDTIANTAQWCSDRQKAMATALVDVIEERDNQDVKWGVQVHGPSRWSDILGEEVGEVSKAILEHCGPGTVITTPLFDDGEPVLADMVTFTRSGEAEVRKELVQVAAVALAWIECIDRRWEDK